MLSREAMTDLGMVATSIDDEAMVRQISARATPSRGSDAEHVVAGGQLTMDLMASHNQSCPSNQVSPSDLLPSLDPDHVCRGSIPLKNGMLSCGCPVRAEAPEAMTHNEVADCENLSRKRL